MQYLLTEEEYNKLSDNTEDYNDKVNELYDELRTFAKNSDVRITNIPSAMDPYEQRELVDITIPMSNIPDTIRQILVNSILQKS